MFTFHLTNRTSVCMALSQCEMGGFLCASDVDVSARIGAEGRESSDLTNGTLMYVLAGYLVI